jgi:hypothetical protein
MHLVWEHYKNVMLVAVLIVVTALVMVMGAVVRFVEGMSLRPSDFTKFNFLRFINR